MIQRYDRGLPATLQEIDLGVGGASKLCGVHVPSSRRGRVADVVAVLQQHSAHPAVVVRPAMATEAILASLLSYLQI